MSAGAVIIITQSMTLEQFDRAMDSAKQLLKEGHNVTIRYE